MSRYRPLLLLLAALLLVIAWEAIAVACPTCKDNLAANDPQRENLVRGYGYSIIFMLSMPFLIFAGMSSYFYYLVCKARREKTAGGQTVAVASPARQTASSFAG